MVDHITKVAEAESKMSQDAETVTSIFFNCWIFQHGVCPNRSMVIRALILKANYLLNYARPSGSQRHAQYLDTCEAKDRWKQQFAL